MEFRIRLMTVVLIVTIAALSCGKSEDADVARPVITAQPTVPTTAVPVTPTVVSVNPTATLSPPVVTATSIPPTATQSPPVPDPASAITHPPADLSVVNTMHDVLLSGDANIRFGTQADPLTVTLGPVDGGMPDYPAYEGKHSLNIQMPLLTPVIAPIDMEFVGFKNRSAEYRQDTPDQSRMEPFDDLELCFESVAADWPGMIVCVYHLHTTPLLQSHLANEKCGIQEKWDGGGAEQGRIYYLENSSERSNRNPESCDPLLGKILNRGDIIGYSGQVDQNPHSGFRFKIRSDEKNPLTNEGDPYLHWVQPKPFFYWQCFDPDVEFQPGVLAYPFECDSVSKSQ
ncbi:MAG: hypothetical protein V3T49_06815 [Dehalococcoidia bacterium]